MISSTSYFINLKKLYNSKAEKEHKEMRELITIEIKENQYLTEEDKKCLDSLVNNLSTDKIDIVDILNKNWPQTSLFVYPDHNLEKEGKNLDPEQIEEDFQKLNFVWYLLFRANKYDFSFITSLHLKKEIRSHGYDEQRVNNDFMMANYHRLSRGIMAIGQSYYVVFMQNFCRVGQIRGITSIESYSETEKINDGTLTRYFIRIYEDDNTVSYFMCADQIASELIINEFNMLGYEVIDKGNTYIENRKKKKL